MHPQKPDQQPPVPFSPPPQQMAYSPQQYPQQYHNPMMGMYTLSVFPSFNSGAAKILGIMQIALGVLLLIFNAIAIRYSRAEFLSIEHQNYSIVAYGIWGGGLIIIAGILEYVAAPKPWKSLVIGYMVMTIIGLCCTIVIIVLAIITADKFGDHFIICDQPGNPPCDWRQVRIVISMNALMVICAFIELAVSIASIAIAFMACCSPENDQMNVATMSSMQAANMFYSAPQNLESGNIKPEPGTSSSKGEGNLSFDHETE